MKVDFITFLPGFLSAFLQNLWMGCLAVVIGLALGIPLARLVHKQAPFQRVVKGLIVFLRSLPVFIVMYIALGILTMTVTIDENNIFSTPVLALLFGLCFSSVSGVFDAMVDYFRLRDAGDRRQALLVIPNVFRLYVNVACTTAVGAALGVKEAVSYSLIATERLTSTGDRLIIVIFVSLFFVCFVLLARWLLNSLIKAKMRA